MSGAKALSGAVKALIALACMAVAVVGYLLWAPGHLTQSEARRAAAEVDRDACLKAVDAYALVASAQMKDLTDRCVDAGFISDQERRDRLGVSG